MHYHMNTIYREKRKQKMKWAPLRNKPEHEKLGNNKNWQKKKTWEIWPENKTLWLWQGNKKN